MRLLNAAILIRLASPTGLITQHIPGWYDAGRSKEENIVAGVKNVLTTIDSEITPLLNEIPLHALGDRGIETSIRADVDFIEHLEPDQDEVFKVIVWDEDSRWVKFKELVFTWFWESQVTRFDERPFLAKLSPFVRIFMNMRKVLSDLGMFQSFTYPRVKDLMTRFGEEDDPVLFRKIGVSFVEARGLEDLRQLLVHVLAPRAELVRWKLLVGHIQTIPRDDPGDDGLLGSLERIVSGILLYSPASQTGLGITEILCPHLLPISVFIAWYWKNITPNDRRMNRLILSFVKICSASPLQDRRSIFSFLSRDCLLGKQVDLDTLHVYYERDDLVEQSREFLESKFSRALLYQDLLVKFIDTPAEGHVGPRNHWFSIMFEEYFRPGNGLFEYSDGRRQFLKPVTGSSFSSSAMAVAGKLIALGIRYEVTIGARLAPCVVYAIRNPREEVADLEGCVKSEDPDFVINLNKLDQLPAETLLADFELTPATLSEYKKKQLYDKGIGSVKEAILKIKKGIDSVVKCGSLELFSFKEFELMVNGIPQLSAETLWSGIEFTNLPQGSQLSEWLKYIIETQDEHFRFAFNRFVTGVPQPPVKPSGPWIKVRVEASALATSLPIAATCFGNLAIPAYPDLETFTRKLVLAVFDGNESLQLV